MNSSKNVNTEFEEAVIPNSKRLRDLTYTAENGKAKKETYLQKKINEINSKFEDDINDVEGKEFKSYKFRQRQIDKIIINSYRGLQNALIENDTLKLENEKKLREDMRYTKNSITKITDGRQTHRLANRLAEKNAEIKIQNLAKKVERVIEQKINEMRVESNRLKAEEEASLQRIKETESAALERIKKAENALFKRIQLAMATIEDKETKFDRLTSEGNFTNSQSLSANSTTLFAPQTQQISQQMQVLPYCNNYPDRDGALALRQNNSPVPSFPEYNNFVFGYNTNSLSQEFSSSNTYISSNPENVALTGYPTPAAFFHDDKL